MLTIKQKLMYEYFKKFYNKKHTKDTVFTESYCKELMKDTIKEIYKIYPDKNVGKVSIGWYDEQLNKVSKTIDEKTYCFEVNFHDLYSGIPWLICRFYRGVARVGMYLQQ